jgi:hypothetical protein
MNHPIERVGNVQVTEMTVNGRGVVAPTLSQMSGSAPGC